MLFQGNYLEKKRFSYLVSLTMFFSYAELLLPRFFPFFKLGLSNIVLLSSFSLSLPVFFLLTVFKAVSVSLISGTLFSPFFIISLSQSVLSGLFMYFLFLLNRLSSKKIVSVYGLSVFGSVLSAFVQIFLTYLFVGRGVFLFSGPMLFFNIISGIITAFFSKLFCIYKKVPDISINEEEQTSFKSSFFAFAKVLVILVLSVSVFFINSLSLLCVFFVLSIFMQMLSGRKIMILPHIFMWIFIFFCSIFYSEGKVIFSFLNISITQGSLFIALKKALRLSGAMFFSQSAVNIPLSKKTVLGLSLAYYKNLCDKLKETKGNVFFRIKEAIKN